MKDGEPLKKGVEFSMLYDDNTAVLQISHGEMRHSGEYTCVATNSVGSASCRAKLALQGLWRRTLFFIGFRRQDHTVLTMFLSYITITSTTCIYNSSFPIKLQCPIIS